MLLSDAVSSSTTGARLVLVPVGSLEQHGPHLPLDTDTAIATAVARMAGDRLGAWAAPAMAYGSSGEHQSFAGTCSIGSDVLRLSAIELVRSIRTWADRVLFVNGHGGNVAALTDAVTQMQHEGHVVDWVPCSAQVSVDGGLHAGRTETSLMLYIAPWNVRLDKAEAGDLRQLQEILPLMRRDGVGSVSTNGVLGDPVGASAEEGRRILEAMTAAVVSAIRTMAA